MKNLIFLILITSISISASAQSASSILSMSKKGSINTQGSPAGSSSFNPWLGAQMLYKFDPESDFSDNLIVSGQILYTPKPFNNESKTFRIPVIGNISIFKTNIGDSLNFEETESKITETILSSEGLNVGLYPYYVIIPYDKDFYFLTHATAVYKLNGFALPDSTKSYFNNFKLSLGFEIGYGILNELTGDRPITLSVTPAYTIIDKGKYKEVLGLEEKNILGLEVAAILPISSTGIGVLLEGTFAHGVDAFFRAGVIMSGQSKK